MKSVCFLVAFWVSAAAADAVPVVAAERWIKAETETRQVWVDKMTDGSFRESTVAKRPTAVRVRLYATNDVGFAWRFDYEARMSDGTVETNSSFSQKTQKERANRQLAGIAELRRGRTGLTNRADVLAANLRAPAARALAAAVTSERRRAPNARAVSVRMAGTDRAVMELADGRTVTNAVARMVSARKSLPERAKGSGKEGSGGGHAAGSAAALAAAALAGAAAGAAAAKGAQAKQGGRGNAA